MLNKIKYYLDNFLYWLNPLKACNSSTGWHKFNQKGDIFVCDVCKLTINRKKLLQFINNKLRNVKKN